MKKKLFAAAMALCLLAGTSAFAQEKKDHKPHEKMTVEQIAKKRADKLTGELKLNDKQSQQVYEYTLEQAKQMEAQREQMRQAHKAAMEKMKAILTPEQFEQWKQMQGPKPGPGKCAPDSCKKCPGDKKQQGDKPAGKLGEE